MAVAYRSSASANSGASTSTTIVVDSPAGVTGDDYLFVAVAYTGGTGVTITPASGFTLVSTSNTLTTYGVQTFRKSATASEPATYTFTLNTSQYVSAISVAYTGIRLLGRGGTYFPQTSIVAVDSTGSSTAAQTTFATTFPYFGMRWVASYNTTSALTVTGAGSGLTTRSDTSTTATSFIQLALTDGLTSTGTMNSIAMPAATLSGSATNNKTITTYLRADQTQITAPAIDAGNISFVNGVTSGNVSLSQSLGNETALIGFHILGAAATITSLTNSDGSVWTQLAGVQNPSNTVRTEVWACKLGPTTGSVVASYTTSASAVMDISYTNFAAAGPIDNWNIAASDAGNPSSVLATMGPNSLVLGFLTDTTGFSSTPTAPNTFLYVYGFLSGTSAATLMQQSVAAAGSIVTSASTLGAAGGWALINVEVPYPRNAGNFLPFIN